jgi:hypothetical protein
MVEPLTNEAEVLSFRAIIRGAFERRREPTIDGGDQAMTFWGTKANGVF